MTHTVTKMLLGLAAVGMIAGLTSPALAQSKEIAVIVKTTNSNYWQNVNKGASAAIKELSNTKSPSRRTGKYVLPAP